MTNVTAKFGHITLRGTLICFYILWKVVNPTRDAAFAVVVKEQAIGIVASLSQWMTPRRLMHETCTKKAGVIMHTVITWTLVLATLASGLLAGISLDKSLVQLPARHQMGVVAFAAFSRAADMGRGLIWYPLLGIGAPALILVAVFLQGIQGFGGASVIPLVLAAALGVVHVLTTSRAAPILLHLRSDTPDETMLQPLYQRFTAWYTVRCILQVATFVVVLWAVLISAQ